MISKMSSISEKKKMLPLPLRGRDPSHVVHDLRLASDLHHRVVARQERDLQQQAYHTEPSSPETAGPRSSSRS
jgi:hypothetical protein